MRLSLLLVLLSVLAPSPVFACSCRPAQDEVQAVTQPSAVFHGTVVAEEPAGAVTKVRFQVGRWFKGAPETREVTVEVEPPGDKGASCGTSFRVGERYMVGVRGDASEGYRTDRCLSPRKEYQIGVLAYRTRTEALRGRLAATPADVASTVALAHHHLQHADWTAARELLRDASAPELLALRGEAELGLLHGEVALADFDRVLAGDPALAAGRRGRTVALALLGRTDGIGPGSDFSRHEMLRPVSLDGFDLSGSTFAASLFNGIALRRCVVEGGNFRHARLVDLDAAGARLRNADFRHAVLVNADLSGADAEGASFRWMTVVGARFVGANLTGADFTAANLEQADFSDARLVGTAFTGAKMTRSKFPGADLSGQYLAGTSMSGTDLSRARLVGADLRGADLSTRAAVTRLQGADLSRARLDQADLSGTQYDCRTRWPDGIDPQAHGAVYDATGCPRGPK